jgi:hypothetical protein
VLRSRRYGLALDCVGVYFTPPYYCGDRQTGLDVDCRAMKTRKRKRVRYVENGITWVQPSELALEYHKHRNTILQWIKDGFISEQLGFRLRKDTSGYWFIGRQLP